MANHGGDFGPPKDQYSVCLVILSAKRKLLDFVTTRCYAERRYAAVCRSSVRLSVTRGTVITYRADYLRNPTLSIDVFKRYFKTFFAQY